MVVGAKFTACQSCFFFCFWQELIQLRVVASANNTPMRTQSFTKSPTSYRVQKLLQRASGNRGSQRLSRRVERFRVFDSLAQQSFGGVQMRVNLIALGGLPVNCFWPERSRKRHACVASWGLAAFVSTVRARNLSAQGK